MNVALRGVDRIAAMFERARSERRSALVPYIVAGDPNRAWTDAVIDAIVAAGADLLELGVPYGDPLADGPTIAAAAQRALAHGATLEGTLDIAARAIERHGIPIVFFTYANPIVQYGIERFASAAAAIGACGAIVPDLPLEECEMLRAPLAERGLAFPLLVAPTTPFGRAASIAERTDGFLYVVSRIGVTGQAREPDVPWIAKRTAALRERTAVPLGVGFGISEPRHVAAIAPHAEAIIIGSALVHAVFDASDVRDAGERAHAFLAPMAAAAAR